MVNQIFDKRFLFGTTIESVGPFFDRSPTCPGLVKVTAHESNGPSGFQP